MQIIKLETGAPAKLEAPLSIALGTFDGVHLGHKALLEECKNHPNDVSSAVFTFTSNPFGTPYIYSLEEKLRAFRDVGIEYACLCDFDEIKNMDYKDFEGEILHVKLGAQKVVCGYDFRYGKQAQGSANTIAEFCQDAGIDYEIIEPVKIDGEIVSSSKIRNLIKNGDITKANKLLSRPYSILAEVIHGNELGRKNGFATINQPIDKDRCEIRHGVYASIVNGHFGMSNVGYKPTVGGSAMLCETHIFDFDQDLYGQNIETELISFVRDEKKFDSIDALFNQLKQDKLDCINLLKNSIL